MAWHTLHKKIKPYLVRIETQGGSGTGFLFAYNATQTIAAIATAAHVVDDAHDWKQPMKLVHYETGDELFLPESDRVVFLDRKRDSASILIASEKLPFPKATPPLMDATAFKKVGVELAWVGFPSVAYPELCFFTGCVSAFLEKEDCYLIDGVAINGVSGGPVFAAYDENTPEIVGTISAYLPNRTGGGALPGLLKAQDISAFQETLKTIQSLDEARKKEKEEAKSEQQALPEPKI